MTRKRTANLMTTSTAALIVAAAPAIAVPQSVIDAIVADLSAQGFTRIEVEIDDEEIEVDAHGAEGEAEFYYSRDGALLSAEHDGDDDDDEEDDDHDDVDDDDDHEDDDDDDADDEDDDDDDGDDDDDDDDDDYDDDDDEDDDEDEDDDD